MAFWPKVRRVLVCLLALGTPTWSGAQTHGNAPVDIRALTLIDQNGKTISLRDLEGRTTVLHFIFTRCVAACHTQVRSLRAVRAALPADTRARVQFVSMSIDPEQDTPETLRRYAQANAIADEDWRFASASPDHTALLTRALGIKRSRLPDGQIDHTLAVLLFDAKGRLMQRYAGPEADTARLVREIGEVVRLFDPAHQSTAPVDGGR